jgi:hypothetical protein
VKEKKVIKKSFDEHNMFLDSGRRDVKQKWGKHLTFLIGSNF